MGKADKHLERFRSQNSQLNPFKNRKKYDFEEMIDHWNNQTKFINKIVNKKK